MTFHNSALARLVPDGNYRADDLARVEAALSDHQTLTFVRLPSGLYAASSAGSRYAATGSRTFGEGQHYVAFAHHATGARHIATEVVEALIGFFTRYCHRCRRQSISGAVDPSGCGQLVRTCAIDGRTLRDLRPRWAHVADDALAACAPPLLSSLSSAVLSVRPRQPRRYMQ